MKAVIITSHGGPSVLQLQERAQPEIGADEVLIQVKAAGVNRPDVSQRKGHYPAPPGAPQDIPGLEVAGIITAIGNNVTQWKIGDGVCALVAGGGYAEYVNVIAGQCLPIPSYSVLQKLQAYLKLFSLYGAMCFNEPVYNREKPCSYMVVAVVLALLLFNWPKIRMRRSL